jgi:hypothetical protein
MAKAPVDICNMALGRLGISQFIGNLETERSNEAGTCRIFYESARDRVLEDFPWSFAKRTVELQDIGTPPADWQYRYRYPNDCLFAREVQSSAGRSNPQTQFEVVEDEANGGLALCTDQEQARLVYTARIANSDLFSQLFIDALAWSLASDIAAPLSATPKMAESAANAYTSTLLKAAARNLNEGREQPEPESEFLTARL